MASGTVEEPIPAPTAPAEPAPQPVDPLRIIMGRLDEMEGRFTQRMDQQATAIVKIAEIVTSPQAQQVTQQPGLMGVIQQLVPGIAEALRSGGGSGDAMNQLYIDVGKSVVEGSLKGTVQRVVKAAGAEGAKHVTGLG